MALSEIIVIGPSAKLSTEAPSNNTDRSLAIYSFVILRPYIAGRNDLEESMFFIALGATVAIFPLVAWFRANTVNILEAFALQGTTICLFAALTGVRALLERSESVRRMLGRVVVAAR